MVPSVPVDESNEPALREYVRQISLQSGKTAALFLAAFTAVLWPTDLLVLQPREQAIVAVLRAIVIAIALGAFALLRLTRAGRAHPLIILCAAGVAILADIGWCAGRLGGPELPWLHFAYCALFLSVIAPLSLWQRTVFTIALTLALFCGFFLPFPEHWHSPLAPPVVSFGSSTTVMVIAMGHLFFRILRQAVYQSRALQLASRQLAELNETLESRVHAQTHDLRRLTAHLDRAREEERKRIARELHDELGQELTALRLAVSLARQRFGRDPQCIGGNLEEIAALVGRTTTTTRQLVHELRPPLVEDLGLRAALEWLVKTTEEHGVRCRLDAGALDGLPAETAGVAYRIAQEALTNVVRHAQAREAMVAIERRGGELTMRVRDDGVGLPADAATSGFGLIGMRERVASLAGRLDIESRSGQGTSLTVVLPLQVEAAA